MSEPNNSLNRAKFYQLALFPMNNGATNVYFVLILSYIATFGNKVLGIAMVFASFMVTGMRVFDAIPDPIIGAVMDKTDGKFGKFRPFMVIGNLVMAVAVILLYVLTPLVPAGMMWLRYTLFILLYAVWVIGYTFQTSVTRSAQPVLTDDPKQRPLFTVFNTIGSLAGMGAMQFLGPIIAGDNIAGDYNATWFAIMTPIGIAVSVLLTVLAIIGIWEKDQTKYFGLGGKQEQVKVSEYLTIIKNNKPLQRLMVAGGGCKLALSIATNVTVLCMLYGCMTQFGMGFGQGQALNGMLETGSGSDKQIAGLQFDADTQILAVELDGDALEYDEKEATYKLNSKTAISSITVTNAAETFEQDCEAKLILRNGMDVAAFCVDENGKPTVLELDEAGMPIGLTRDASGKITGLNVEKSNRIIGLLADDHGQIINSENELVRLGFSESGELVGLKAEDTVKLASRNRYDSLYLIMMVMGYVFSAPFFLLTVRTSQKHGQKKSLMTYVAVAFLCYIGVLVMMLLWKFGNPAWNLSVYEGELFKPGFRLTINLYTILFTLFFGVGYGAYYATADMPIPMVADCADYETYRSGKFIPGIMGTLFSLVDKLVSSLSATVVSIALLFIGVQDLPTKATPYVEGMNWVVIALFCLIPMCAWLLTLWAMRGYELDGKRVKVINAVNAARKEAIAKGMSTEEALRTFTDDTVKVKE